jgi:phospholipid/cholesterol/gamma-HCH transport system substrate-binding protein
MVMSKPVNKTLVGAFVAGALILVVAALAIFGAGKFFTKRNQFVLDFDESVKGLSVGSPVMFRGVKVGQVIRIVLTLDPKDLKAFIPVYIEIEPETVTIIGGQKAVKGKNMKDLIYKKGLKGQLQMQSFVTGQLMVALDFFPDKPIRLVGLDKKVNEIPTVPTTLVELTKTIQNLDIEGLFKKLEQTVDGIERIVNSPKVTASLDSLDKTLKDFNVLLVKVNSKIDPLSASLISTSEQAQKTLARAEKTLSFGEGEAGKLTTSAQETLTAARQLIENLEKASVSIKNLAENNSTLGYQVNKTLEDISAMARTLRSLADYLEQHPESLIRGKKLPKGE